MSMSSTTSRIITMLMLALTSDLSAGWGSFTEKVYSAVCTQNYLSVAGSASKLELSKLLG